MKESIGGVQLFIIVVTLVVLFAGIMGLTINRSNAYAIKTKVVSIIEENEGYNLSTDTTGVNCQIPQSGDKKTICEIVNTINEYNYMTTGKCPDGFQGYLRNGNTTNGAAAFCIKKDSSGSSASAGTLTKYSYRVVLFYAIDLPVVKELLTFKANGQTKSLFR